MYIQILPFLTLDEFCNPKVRLSCVVIILEWGKAPWRLSSWGVWTYKIKFVVRVKGFAVNLTQEGDNLDSSYCASCVPSHLLEAHEPLHRPILCSFKVLSAVVSDFRSLHNNVFRNQPTNSPTNHKGKPQTKQVPSSLFIVIGKMAVP